MVSTTTRKSIDIDLSRVRSDIRLLQPQLVEWRRRLHQHPELGFKEQLTAEFVAQKLHEWGIEHQTGIAKTGIVATIRGKRQEVRGERQNLETIQNHATCFMPGKESTAVACLLYTSPSPRDS